MTNIQPSGHNRILRQVTFYDDLVKVFIPVSPITKGVLKTPNQRKKKLTIEEAAEHSTERSIDRTKQKIREYALCNKFSMFVTFTFKEDRYDDQLKFQQMKTWLDNQRKRLGTFKYVLVPERHKDGAYHFHALFADYNGRIISKKLKNGRMVYKLGSYKLGISDVEYIKSDKRTRNKTASYISKYITKEMPMLPGKKRYWCSQDLSRPLKMNNPPDWILQELPVWEGRSDYGHTIYLDYSDELKELRASLENDN